MADTRTLKLALLADVQKFLSGMNEAETSTKGLSSKINKYSKAMAKSFAIAGAAAGAYAIKIGVDSVNAAIEDEKSQRILAIQLEKTVGANDKAIASVEDYISKTQLRVGVQDDKLRPSLARLVRSTEDVAKAQQLLNLSLDISVATGKDVDTVANALGKAYDGNSTALGRLGLGIDSSILKSNDLDLIIGTLTKTFGGFADKEAKSFDGQLRIVKIRIDELKEGIGAGLLPVLSNLLTNVNLVAQGFSGDDPQGLSARARELAGNFEGNGANSLGGALRALVDAFSNLFGTITADEPGASTGLQNLANAMQSVANGINAIAGAYRSARDLGGKILDLLIINPGEGPKFADSALGKKLNYKKRALGGPVSNGQSYLVGERGPEMFTPNVGGRIIPNGGSGQTIININGVIDAESARRSIEKLLQNSARRTGPINLIGASL